MPPATPQPTPLSDFEQVVAELHAQLGVPDLDYGILRLAQAEHAPARRVTWIPISFETYPIDHTGPIRGDAAELAIYAEKWLVEAHIVGESFHDAELIRVRIVDVCRRVLNVASVPVGGLWVTQAIGGAAHSFGGLEKVVQRFRWDMFLFAPPPLATTETTIERVITTVELPEGGADSETFTEPSP